MEDLPRQFILSRKPKQYLKQGLSNCGVYSVKAILSAYGKDVKDRPKEYHTSWIGRNFGITPDGNKKYYEKILRLYGLKAETNTAKHLPEEERLLLLKTLLSQDAPVMIRSGNGYALNNRYNPFLGMVIPHWITLWGYDDDKELFYVYDSGLPQKYWDLTLLIGNTTRTYQEILRDWNFGTWQFWAWNNSREPYLYIKVRTNGIH